MAEPTDARFCIYRGQPDALDAALARVQQELIPLARRQPGFRHYLGVRSGPDSVVSASAWESRAAAEAAGRTLSGWARAAMGPGLASVEEHIGELAHITEAAKARPGFVRFALLQLKPGQQEGLLQRVEGEVVPLLLGQPGFIRLLVWRTGPDRAMVVTHYAARAEGEAATRGWVERHVAPAVASVQWHEGEVIWRVRDDPPS